MQQDPEYEQAYNYGLQLDTPVLDLLEKVRQALFRVLAFFVLAFVFSAVLVHNYGITEYLIKPIVDFLPNGRLAAFSPLTPFMLELKVALLLSASISIPIVLFYVWQIIKPRFDPDQARLIRAALAFGAVLFSVGIAFAYIVLPFILKLMFAFQADYMNLVIEADQYFGFVVIWLLAFGIMFQLPVVVMILTSLGLVTPKFLSEKRRHAIALIVFVGSVVIPGDINSSIPAIVAGIGLYEISIHVSKLVVRRDRKIEARRAATLAEEAAQDAARVETVSTAVEVIATPQVEWEGNSDDDGSHGGEPPQDGFVEEHP